MKENYKPWEIKVTDFPVNAPLEKQIAFLVGFAVLAPSGHNAQPWRCQISSNVLKVFSVADRALKQSDPEERQLLLSFGCFLENLLIAGDYFGFKANVNYKFNPTGPSEEIFEISFSQVQSQTATPEHLIFQIPLRHSDRLKYQDKPADIESLNQLEKLAVGDLKLNLISDREIKNKVAEIMSEAQVNSMEDGKFREELSHFVKSSFTKEKLGMPGFALGIPAPVSVFIPKIIKKVNLSKLSLKQDLNLLKDFTPVIAVLSSRQDDKTTWVEAGKIFEKIWLTGVKKDFAVSVWAAAVQEPKSRERLQKTLNNQFKPLVIFRLGYPKGLSKPSPRFSTKEICL